MTAASLVNSTDPMKGFNYVTDILDSCQSFKKGFYVQYALQDIEALSLQQMLQFGRAALFDDSKILTSARHAQREVCCWKSVVF